MKHKRRLRCIGRIRKISDSFLKKQEQPELELLVTVYNINWGYNEELMKACSLLSEYAQYVNQVRQFAEDMPFGEAVGRDETWSVAHGVCAMKR